MIAVIAVLSDLTYKLGNMVNLHCVTDVLTIWTRSHAFLTKEHLISSSCWARLSFQPWVFQHPRAPKHPRLEAGPNDQLTGALLVICTKRAILLALILY